MKLIVDNREYRGFNNGSVVLIYNTIASTFSFFSLENILPRPFSYDKCEIIDDNNNDELLITGYVINQGEAITSKPQLATVSGFSLPGIIEDSNTPIDIYPLQSDNLNLDEIASKFLSPFDLKYIVDPAVKSAMEKKYKKTSIEPEQSIKDYLSNLASQRGIILTHDNKGNILFTKVDVSALEPVASFAEGNPGIMECSIEVNGQAMHNEITVIRQASSKNPDAGQFTIRNPYCPIVRPKTKILDSGDIFDVEKAARNELSSELESIKLKVVTTKFIKPGNLIQFKSNRLKIKVFTDFFVISTRILFDTRGDKYELTCCVKDVYTEDTPKNIFLQQNYSGLPKF